MNNSSSSTLNPSKHKSSSSVTSKSSTPGSTAFQAGPRTPRPKVESLDDQHFDMLVIGGGITGAGVAQDAASRGLKTLLVEKGDFASGTSSKSTKLIHGGLRYLANMQFAVTIESLAERRMQQELAPHMVWSVPFVVPTYRGEFFKNFKLRCGLMLYDLLAGFGNKLRHKSISSAELARLCPGVRREKLNGGLLYYDCRTDDARHTLEVILSAVDCGATAINYLRLQSGIKDDAGQLIGAVLCDELTQRQVKVFASQIVNATGVWTDATAKSAASHFDGKVLASKGVHICIDRRRLPIEAATIIPSLYDERYLFAVPWYDHVIIGTTDTAYDGDIEHPKVEPEEMRYMLDAVNRMFPTLRLSEADVRGQYAGLRPLLQRPGKSKTADLSRQHSLEVSPDGLVSISGGKLTTYRLMAKETVDFAMSRITGATRQACRTNTLRMGGFNKGDDVKSLIASLTKQALDLGLSESTAQYLPAAYGKRCLAILALIKERPELAQSLAPGHPYILAQAVHAVRYEFAQTIADVLARRTRLTILDKSAALAAAEKVFAAMAPELSWTAEEKESKLRAFRAELE